jgi:uncharacterized protein (TIGR03437 family)
MPGGGAHFVAGTGVRGDGSIAVADPVPALSRGTLESYVAAGAKLTGAIRFLPRSPSPSMLVVFADAPLTLSSPAGPCGETASWPALAAATEPRADVSNIYLAACDGRQRLYQLDVAADAGFRGVFTDQGEGGARVELSGAGASSFKIVQEARWTVAAQETSFSATSVVNAASFENRLAPGAIVSVFGSGLGTAARPTDTVVEVNGRRAQVLAVFPFQANFVLPLDLPPGNALLRVRSPYGAAEQTIVVNDTAPAVFSLGGGQPAILNQDFSLNTARQPARRGQVVIVYGTGFGAVVPQGPLQAVRSPVSAQWNGSDWPVTFAGLTPGFVGLYQINAQVPAGTPPALDGKLTLSQDGVSAAAVTVAVQ